MSTRISAYISDATKAEVEAFVKRYGISEARLIEKSPAAPPAGVARDPQ
jgi:hypothetical protein